MLDKNFLKFNVSSLHKDDLVALCDNTELVFDAYDITSLNPILASMLADLKSKNLSFKSAINKERNPELSKQIKDLDILRDKYSLSILRGIKYYLSVSTIKENEAAKTLNVFLSPYGAFIKLPLSSQTSVTDTICKTIAETPKLTAASKCLKLEQDLNASAECNANFAKLYLDRNNQDGDKITNQKAIYLRVKLRSAYVKLSNQVEYIHEYQYCDTINNIFKSLQALRRKAHILIERRKHNKVSGVIDHKLDISTIEDKIIEADPTEIKLKNQSKTAKNNITEDDELQKVLDNMKNIPKVD